MDNNNYDNILFELKVLGKIKKYDKLTTSNDKIGIDSGGVLQPVIRAYNGDSRISTMNRIEQLCNNIYEFVNKNLNLLKNNTMSSGFINNNIFNKKYINNENLKQMWLEMAGAVKGLENLKITYENDASTESNIDLCIDKLKNYIDDITTCLYSPKNNGMNAGAGMAINMQQENIV